MHAHSLDPWRHEHVFLGQDHARNERRSWAVVALCGAMMAAEIVGGLLWGSMALIADGLHMSTHAGALVIAAFAYAYARRHARDERFVFGTGKLGDLAAFSSALVLAMIALLIGYESIGRLIHPVPIAFDEAIPLAAVGLLVNLLSALLLARAAVKTPMRRVNTTATASVTMTDTTINTPITISARPMSMSWPTRRFPCLC